MAQTRFSIRPIEAKDNAAVQRVISQVMGEFACVGTGYSIEDPELSAMSEAYADARNRFFVLTQNSTVVGCGGFGQLRGADASVCELRKMYLLPTARGHGQGKRLMEHCLAAARAAGYQRMYLETVVRMEAANGLYRSYGFAELPEPLGATGHSGCDAYFVRDL